MLTDPKAIEIIANAKQKNVRDPKRSRKHFENIFKEFFEKTSFAGTYIDMGPGQFDFGVMAKQLGADQCFAIENDPVVVELGEYLGFEVIEGNIKNFSRQMTGNKLFNGVFNKFSYNCFWYCGNPQAHEKFVEEVFASIVEGGWAWIAPWNGVPKAQNLSDSDIQQMLQEQAALFTAKGFKTLELSDSQAKKFGIHGTVASNVIFTYGL